MPFQQIQLIIMGTRNKIFNLILVTALISCKCDNEVVEGRYENKALKYFYIIDCNTNHITEYGHYTIDGELGFGLAYIDGIPQKPFIGSPWIHLIWEKSNHFLGDTIALEIDIATPPKLTSKFSIHSDEGVVIDFPKDSTFNYFIYANDSIETFQLRLTYYLDGVKWVTVKKQLTIECESPPRPRLSDNGNEDGMK
ncbi:MAG: hypothetical protein ACI8ZO_000801 [Flavobacteriales bacterium]|jgi:hypothetical protein